jgi:hypothetical protein
LLSKRSLRQHGTLSCNTLLPSQVGKIHPRAVFIVARATSAFFPSEISNPLEMHAPRVGCAALVLFSAHFIPILCLLYAPQIITASPQLVE